MYRKIKYAVSITVITLILLAVLFILVSLDKLDYQYYGLNYNLITAGFSEQIVYSQGLHLIGFSNILLEIPKIFQQISFPLLQTYTSDYFPLTISAEVSYKVMVSNETDTQTQFEYLKNYYILFGSLEEQRKVLEPIIRNQIIKSASSYSSVNYREQKTLSEVLQQTIEASLSEIVSRWTQIEFSVLISSIVCEGISFNIQPYQRQISSLIAQSQRVQAQKIQMTNFIESLLQKTRVQMSITESIISNNILAAEMLSQQIINSGINLGEILLKTEQSGKNLSFMSSQLSLRPELYLIDLQGPV